LPITVRLNQIKNQSIDTFKLRLMTTLAHTVFILSKSLSIAVESLKIAGVEQNGEGPLLSSLDHLCTGIDGPVDQLCKRMWSHQTICDSPPGPYMPRPFVR